MNALSLSPYVATRVRSWRMISYEVTRPSAIAVCISRMPDSTTVNGCLAVAAGGGLWAARRRAIVAKTREFVIANLPLEKNGKEAYNFASAETTSSPLVDPWLTTFTRWRFFLTFST